MEEEMENYMIERHFISQSRNTKRKFYFTIRNLL